jgi:hypothetical protein
MVLMNAVFYGLDEDRTVDQTIGRRSADRGAAERADPGAQQLCSPSRRRFDFAKKSFAAN